MRCAASAGRRGEAILALPTAGRNFKGRLMWSPNAGEYDRIRARLCRAAKS